MWLPFLASAALLLCPTAAQVPADLERLATRVDAAHRVGSGPATITSFRAGLAILGLASDGERGEAELSVSFLEWTPPDRDRSKPLIRYRVVDSARPIEQGRDREDYWGLSDGRVVDLRGKEYATDLDNCRRNLKLARQILRFLDPGAVLRGLEQPDAVHEETLQLGRSKPVACLVAAGRLPGFPLRQQAGDDAPVRARVFVGKDDGRLLALQVTPLADGDSAPAGEFLFFADHRPHQGRLVPMQVTHFDIGPGGVRRPQFLVRITTLELAADLRVEDLDRPRS